MPHTADLMIEAWGPDRRRCVAEAVLALCESFADAGGCFPAGTVELRTMADRDPARLVEVLEEVIYLLDAEGVVAVGVDVAGSDADLVCRFEVVPMAQVTLVGSTPKAVSWHGLAIGPDEQGWSCHVVIDV